MGLNMCVTICVDIVTQFNITGKATPFFKGSHDPILDRILRLRRLIKLGDFLVMDFIELFKGFFLRITKLPERNLALSKRFLPRCIPYNDTSISKGLNIVSKVREI